SPRADRAPGAAAGGPGRPRAGLRRRAPDRATTWPGSGQYNAVYQGLGRVTHRILPLRTHRAANLGMEFVCHVGTADGQVRRETRSAPDEQALRAELDREGLHLLGVERSRTGRLRATWRGFGRRSIPLPDLLVFNQELAALLKAGLPLL